MFEKLLGQFGYSKNVEVERKEPTISHERNSTGYEGAGRSKSRPRWSNRSSGPNTALQADLNTLRNRSFTAIRDHPLIKRAVFQKISNEIGVGIMPRSTCSNKDIRMQLNSLFRYHFLRTIIDANEGLPWGGLQALWATSRVMGGDCFVQLLDRPTEMGLELPFQIKVVEGALCPHDYDLPLDTNPVKCGIRFDGTHNFRRSYIFYSSHPNEPDMDMEEQYIEVSARDIIHHYRPYRPGQLRGEPELAASLKKNFDVEEYDAAELEKKKTHAAFTGAIEKHPNFIDEEYHNFNPIDGQPLHELSEPQSVDIETGTMAELLPGEKITMFDTDKGGDNYDPYMRNQHQKVIAGLNIPYEFGTGDYRHVNDRVVRFIQDQFLRGVRADQKHLDEQQVIIRVWERFVEVVARNNIIRMPDFDKNKHDYLSHKCTPDVHRYVHALQDTQAKREQVDAGMDSLLNQMEENGRDPEDVLDDEKRLQEMREERGLNPKEPAE